MAPGATLLAAGVFRLRPSRPLAVRPLHRAPDASQMLPLVAASGSATSSVTVTGAFFGFEIMLGEFSRGRPRHTPSVDVEPAECEHDRGEGAQAGDDQDGKVAGAGAAVDLAVPDRPVEQ